MSAAAQAGETGTAMTTKIGMVHEHAVPKGCARLHLVGKTLVPIFTHRIHYGAPKARGHRVWLQVRR